LYVCGEIDFEDLFDGDLWCFDLREHVWKAYTTKGDIPWSREKISSLIIQENLYIFASYETQENSVFVLNLNSLEWKRPHRLINSLLNKGDIHGKHLFIAERWTENPRLSYWNIRTNRWSTFDFQSIGQMGNIIVYKDSLVAFGRDVDDKFFMASFNLDTLDLEGKMSPQGKRWASLFMNQRESDVAFKVQDKILPAHKERLIQKSKYFKNLFNSGMIESRQEIIEFPDCEYIVFQEFMRFIYYDKVRLDIDLAFKLFRFADKHLQHDLEDKCLGFLSDSVSFNTVYKILDFAFEQSLNPLQTLCEHFCLLNLNMSNVLGLVKYLNKQNNQDFDQEKSLRDEVLNLLLIRNYIKICQNQEQKQNIQFYEEFIIKNIEPNSIIRISEFIWDDRYQDLRIHPWSNSAEMKESRVIFEQATLKVKHAVFEFIQRNFKKVHAQRTRKHLPADLFVDYAAHLTEKINEYEKEANRSLEIKEKKQRISKKSKKDENIENQHGDQNDEESGKKKAKRGRKRKEPVQDESLEESPTLKQTKKTPVLKENK